MRFWQKFDAWSFAFWVTILTAFGGTPLSWGQMPGPKKDSVNSKTIVKPRGAPKRQNQTPRPAPPSARTSPVPTPPASPPQAKSSPQTPPTRPRATRLGLPFAVSALFSREQWALTETGTGRQEPLFNDLWSLGLGIQGFYRLAAAWEIQFPIVGFVTIPQLKNADPTSPVTPVSQTFTVGGGAAGGALWGWRFFRSPDFFCVISVGALALARYQKFGTSAEGTLNAKELAVHGIPMANFKLGLSPTFSMDFSYGWLNAKPLNPHFGVSLSFEP